MPVKERVSVMQGLTVELEVYVSGYPTPSGAQITWQRPNQSVIMDSDEGVEFQDDRGRLILSDVQPWQAGPYVCHVFVSLSPYQSSKVEIHLEVYGSTSKSVLSIDYIDNSGIDHVESILLQVSQLSA